MLATYPVLTLLPPLVAIVLVIATKKVLPSLGAGSVIAALLIADFRPLESLRALWDAVWGQVWADGAVNWYTFLIIAFLLELGILTSLILMSGGTQAFSNWAEKRISSRRGAKAFVGLLGLALFIDDYFNALAVGQISRPVTDKYRISHAKLAYLIHTSAAPVVVLAPFSSWGATIIGIIAPILAASALTVGQLAAFTQAALMNYYAISALAFLWFTTLLGSGYRRMRLEEERAIAGDGLVPPNDTAPGQLSDSMPAHHSGTIRSLLIPFILLLAGVFVAMFVTGGLAAGEWNVLSVLSEADVPLSLNVGGILAVVSAAFFMVRYTGPNPEFEQGVRRKGVLEGAKSMMPAILILLFAWVLAALVGELGTGEFLASLVEGRTIEGVWLLPLMFVLAGVIAFATGTSWGSFGILLPLAGEMMNAVPNGHELLIPAFGAVLAGAVMGDHSSPISDTTILSSTGASCAVPTHVVTQVPYVLSSAGAALAGYLVFAATENGLVGLAATVLGALAVAFATRSGGVRSDFSPAKAQEADR